ncbi:Transmembrane protein 120A [Galdieria sulphuraria]|nr:Transmembrane protein 120A [Galdieria sulphuraria]
MVVETKRENYNSVKSGAEGSVATSSVTSQTTPLLDWEEYLRDVESAHREFESKYRAQKKDVESLKSYLKDINDTVQYTTAKEKVESWSCDLKQLSSLMPVSGGLFVELFLGTTDLRFRRRQQRIAFKTQYELYKKRLGPFFVWMTFLCFLFERNRWLHMLLQLFLAYYYASLAIRENILRANGSNIKSWWIWHHYLSMGIATCFLTWPDSTSYAMFRNRLHIFGMYTALLQILQARYQMARLYTLRSLGKAGELDVANTDSTQIHWGSSMKLLMPFVIVGQFIQLYNCIFLYGLWRMFPLETQILVASILFLSTFAETFVLREIKKEPIHFPFHK